MSTVPRERFFRVYANLPIGVRSEIIFAPQETGPMSWNVVYTEVNNGTKLGDTIVEKLVALEII